MDLSFCLYCEKHLSEENVSFCSSACQKNEASKPIYSSEKYTSTSLSVFIKTKTKTPYKFSYHRRPYSPSNNVNHYPLLTSSTSTSTASSTTSNSSFHHAKQNYSSFFNHIQHNVYTKYF